MQDSKRDAELKILRVMSKDITQIDEHPFLETQAAFENAYHEKYYVALKDAVANGATGGIPLKRAIKVSYDNLFPDFGPYEDLRRAVMSVTSSPRYVHEYMSEIFDGYAKRSIASLGNRLSTCSESSQDYGVYLKQIDDLHKSISAGFGVDECVSKLDAIKKMNEKVVRLQSGDTSDYLATGIKSIDDIMKGFTTGTLALIAARPAVGKTAFSLCVAESMDRNNIQTGFLSVEMSVSELMERLVQIRSGVSLDTIVGNPTSADLEAYKEASVYFGRDSKMIIKDTTNRSLSNVRRIIRRMKTDNPELKIVFVDYIQKIKVHGFLKKNEAVDEIAQSLTDLAKDLDICIAPCAQLNRDTYNQQKGGSGYPSMSNLKDSGGLEQEAHYILLIHRKLQDQFSSNEADMRSLDAEIIIAKNRGGRTGIAKVIYDAPVTHFRSKTQEEFQNERFGKAGSGVIS